MAGPSHLKPGEKGSILIKVTTAGRLGDVMENVEVRSTDPVRPQITLTIKAYVLNADMPFLTPSH
jgi:hypothetical protein